MRELVLTNLHSPNRITSTATSKSICFSQLHIAFVLLQTLKATAEKTSGLSRVILMSSEMYRFSPSSTSFASVEEINTDISATELYAHSKLAQILITRELARRLEKGELGFAQSPSHRFVIVNAMHLVVLKRRSRISCQQPMVKWLAR